MPSFVDQGAGKIIKVPGTPKSMDPTEYDRQIAAVWKLAGEAITIEHAILWTRLLAKERDALAAVSS